MIDENIGLEGIPANDRWYSNDQLIETFDWALDISKHLEKLGFQEFWMAEHHFQPEGYEATSNCSSKSSRLASESSMGAPKVSTSLV